MGYDQEDACSNRNRPRDCRPASSRPICRTIYAPSNSRRQQGAQEHGKNQTFRKIHIDFDRLTQTHSLADLKLCDDGVFGMLLAWIPAVNDVKVGRKTTSTRKGGTRSGTSRFLSPLCTLVTLPGPSVQEKPALLRADCDTGTSRPHSRPSPRLPWRTAARGGTRALRSRCSVFRFPQRTYSGPGPAPKRLASPRLGCGAIAAPLVFPAEDFQSRRISDAQARRAEP
jgi:hypothetical protein